MSEDKWGIALIIVVMLQMGVIHLQIVVLGHKIDAVKCFERIVADKSEKPLSQYRANILSPHKFCEEKIHG